MDVCSLVVRARCRLLGILAVNTIAANLLQLCKFAAIIKIHQTNSFIPYSAKFSRDKIFADWPFTKFRGNNIRGLRILVSHAQSDAAAARAARRVVRADVHTRSIVRSCCVTVTLDLTTATAKGSLLFPGSLVQGRQLFKTVAYLVYLHVRENLGNFTDTR